MSEIKLDTDVLNDGSPSSGYNSNNRYALEVKEKDPEDETKTITRRVHLLVDWADLENKPLLGNVSGPASSTDNAIARFNGTTGKVIQDSKVLIKDDGSIRLDGSSKSVDFGGVFCIRSDGAKEVISFGYEDAFVFDKGLFGSTLAKSNTLILGDSNRYWKEGFINTMYLNTIYSSSAAASNKLPITFDANNDFTIPGKLIVKTNGSLSANSYNDGIRVLPCSSGWADIFFSNNTSTSGTHPKGWLVGKRGSRGSVSGSAGDFTIESNGSIGAGLTLYANGDRPTWNGNRLAYESDIASSNLKSLKINGKTYNGSADVDVGTIGVAYGGTGKTNGEDAANYFINSLSVGTSVPVDTDYFISQYVNGGNSVASYHRRPISKIWDYIKTKDGSGSGLDADLLDGKEASDFVDRTSDQTINGNKTFTNTVIAPKFKGTSTGVYWYQGRDSAAFRDIGNSGYHAALSLKTTNGSWEFGTYNENGWHNIPLLTYITDADYSAGNNTRACQLQFPLKNGTVALTSDIKNPENYYWANIKVSSSSSTTTTPTFGNTAINGKLTISNDIIYKGTQSSCTIIKFIDNASDPYGNGIAIGGGGATIIGGGESTDEIRNNAIANGGSEVMAIGNDAGIDFYTNCQNGFGQSKKITMNTDGTISTFGFKKSSSSDDYVLLGGGGHKAITDFATSDYTRTSHYLRTFSHTDASHGNDYLLKVRHNVDNNDRFKLQIVRTDGTVTHSTSVDYANSAGNADTVDNEHASAFAHIAAHNNLTASGNEFTFASSGFSGAIWLNYRTAGGTNGNITEYNLGNGAGGLLGSIIHSGNIGSYISGTSGYIPKFTGANSIGNGWQAKDIIGTSHCDWQSNTYASGQLITLNTLSYWNGAVNSGGASNLKYCERGEIAALSDIPNVPDPTNYYWANVSISSTSSTTTNPTFATVIASTVRASSNNSGYLGTSTYHWGFGYINNIRSNSIIPVNTSSGSSANNDTGAIGSSNYHWQYSYINYMRAYNVLPMSTASGNSANNNYGSLGSSSYYWNTAYINTIYGSLSGNASSSTKSSKLVQNTETDSSAEGGLTWFNADTPAGASVNTNDGPSANWWYILRNRHTNTSNNYYTDLAIPFTNDGIYYKIVRDNAVQHGGWVRVIDSLNIGSQSVSNADKVDGYHASSLWRSDGATWNPSANVTLSSSNNGDEWSFDIHRNGHSGTLWHVWDSSLSTMLGVTPDNGHVIAPYGFDGPLTNSDGSIKMYCQYGDEVNFGGSSGSRYIYFGYRNIENRSAPTTYIFGTTSNLAGIKASNFYPIQGNHSGTIGGSGTRWGSIFVNWLNYESLTNGSDIRIKTNIEDFSISALPIINNIKLRNYQYKTTVKLNEKRERKRKKAIEKLSTLPKTKDNREARKKLNEIIHAKNDTDEIEVGLIAQELEKSLPKKYVKTFISKIDTNKNSGEYTIKTNNLIMLLWKAIQEQQEIIDKQQQTLDNFTSRLERLEKLLGE